MSDFTAGEWFTILLAGIGAGAIVFHLCRLGERVRTRLLPAPEPDEDPPEWNPIGECICGRQVAGDDWHIIVAFQDDDEELGIQGGTAMSADFCAEHCPGGCRQGCAVPIP
jgi:hypothetical protein